jgi:hypothetical protein
MGFRFYLGVAVGEQSGKRPDFSDPTRVVFALELNPRHAYLSARGA